jgi:Fe-S-cluster-containing dehydrogenase component
MKISRKQFLRLSGITLLAAATERLAGFLALARQKSIPSGRPASPPRWAMVIDMPRCRENENCTQCIDACRAAHNIPHLEDPAHRIDWIWNDSFEKAFPSQANEHLAARLKGRPVLLLCNHCDNPPCVRVCPTRATWKREDGIVMMDYHRCIGCRYCMAACPYGSRSFNWMDPRPYIAQLNPEFPTRSKGVVEKCSFCEERLARGRLPACVEACPQKALQFGDLNDRGSGLAELLESRFSIRRRPELGTKPQVFYLV